MGPLGAWLLHPGGGVSGRAPGHFIPDPSFSPSLSPLLQSKGEMGRGWHRQSRAQHLVTSPERAVGSRRHSTCGRPTEGLACEAEIKLRLDGQESTSFSEQSSWSVETLERFGNLSPESLACGVGAEPGRLTPIRGSICMCSLRAVSVITSALYLEEHPKKQSQENQNTSWCL